MWSAGAPGSGGEAVGGLRRGVGGRSYGWGMSASAPASSSNDVASSPSGTTPPAAPSPAARPAASFPGPACLGRGVVVEPGDAVPDGFPDGAPTVVVDEAALAAPAEVVATLHDHWVHRRRVVVRLAVANAALQEPEVVTEPPYELPTDTTMLRERLRFLVWANNYDARGSTVAGRPTWWHGHVAEQRGALRSDEADVLLTSADDVGVHAWVDNGPRGPLPVPSVHYESVQLGRLTLQRNAEPAEDLAPDQLAAVVHGQGPARIIAPAGSGKTRVLTARLRHLLLDRGVEHDLVTALAYNTRAAEEMRDRLGDVTARLGVRRLNVRTIHSIAYEICRWQGPWEVLGERDVRSVLERLLRTPRIPNKDPFAPYLEALAEVRIALRHPDDVEAERDDVDGFADLFPRYREELERRGALDFDEQVYRAIELLLTRPDLRARAQRACTHLLVDEFQDLTPAFLLLVRLLASPRLDVFGVGDDDQVIYGHAGASPRYLLRYGGWFPGAGDHPLEVNYRCPPDVVEGASNLLTHNHVRVAKTIRAAEHHHPVGQALRAEGVAPDAMANRAVEVIKEWAESGQVQPSDVAVLARVNSALLPVQVACRLAGIPANAPLDAQVLGRTGIRSALAWIRMACDLDDLKRDDVWDTLRRPNRKVASRVREVLPGGRLSITRLDEVHDRLADAGKAHNRFGEYLDDLRLLAERIEEGADTARVLWVIRNRIGLGEVLDVLDASKGRADGSSHTDDLDALEQLAAMHPDPRTFRHWLVEALRLPGRDDGVLLSTIHKVKGREWPRVIVFAANSGLLPHRLAEEVEEERRVFHVAVTRCSEQVVVLANKDAPSPFIKQLAKPRPAGPAGATKAAAVEPPDPRLRREDTDRRVARAAAAPPSLVADASRGTTTADAAERAAAAGPADADLFERLRAWRAELARSTGKPAYTIFSNVTLLEIAEVKPTDLRALARVRGIGPSKLEQYGDEVLEIVEAATAD